MVFGPLGGGETSFHGGTRVLDRRIRSVAWSLPSWWAGLLSYWAGNVSLGKNAVLVCSSERSLDDHCACLCGIRHEQRRFLRLCSPFVEHCWLRACSRVSGSATCVGACRTGKRSERSLTGITFRDEWAGFGSAILKGGRDWLRTRLRQP